MSGGKISPPWLRRGGCAINKLAPFLSRRRRGGWFQASDYQRWLEPTTPSATFKGCCAMFLEVASTPPLPRRGIPSFAFAKTTPCAQSMPQQRPVWTSAICPHAARSSRMVSRPPVRLSNRSIDNAPEPLTNTTKADANASRWYSKPSPDWLPIQFMKKP